MPRSPLLLALLALLSCVHPDPLQPKAHDCNLHWAQITHDSFDPAYRSHPGAIPTDQEITLRLRAQRGDLSSVRLRLWLDRQDQALYLPMQKTASDPRYDWWSVTFSTGVAPNILYYFFELNDDGQSCQPAQDFYVDDDPQRYGGGTGLVIDDYDDWRSFQITVYDPSFQTPAWTKGAVVYQLFPDRFRDGDPTNNPTPHSAFYDDPDGVLFRSNTNDWSAPLCDPRGVLPNACPGAFGQNFYGGDLAGITRSIDEGYLDAVDALYLNPINRAPSNHRYDPYSWSELDPALGTADDLAAFFAAAKAHHLRVILDGVFNHLSSDSPWFDRYHHHATEGACESKSSAYQGFFVFSDAPLNAKDATCGAAFYKTFGGYSSLVALAHNRREVRQAALQSVAYWNSLGASGWRLDAAPDIDPGATNDPTNSYWEDFRVAVKHDPEQLIIGEAWGDAAPWLLGQEWDSATNYRLQGALLSWLFSRCSGEGCRDGVAFSDGDHNAQSFSGELQQISLAQLNARLLSIWEDYPPEAFASLMNLLGTHDTNRVLFLLRKISGDDREQAQQKLRLAWIFLMAYPGMPTLYYGDEAGVDAPGVWDGATWQDDPYNRATLPEQPTFDPLLRKLSALRRAHPVLQRGTVEHGVLLDEALDLYGFTRTLGEQSALIVLNRGAQRQRRRVTLPPILRRQKNLTDALTDELYPVTDGEISLSVEARSGVILLSESP